MFLDAPGYAWKLEEGEIKIQGLTPFLGTLEEGPISGGSYWHATGDIGELTERGSIRVLGRRESLINVGGEKVFPEQVESFILEDEDVRDVLATGIPSALSGQTVVAKVVFAGEADERGLIRRLRKAAMEKGKSLANVPTRIESVERIEKTGIGKRFRGSGKT